MSTADMTSEQFHGHVADALNEDGMIVIASHLANGPRVVAAILEPGGAMSVVEAVPNSRGGVDWDTPFSGVDTPSQAKALARDWASPKFDRVGF